MHAIRSFLTLVLLFVTIGIQASEPIPVKIPSARKCEATVEPSEGKYIITVNIQPVRCFDPATNKSLSVRKAKNMALTALLTYLKPGQKNVTLSCTGLETIKSEFSSLSCRVVCCVPQDGIEFIDSARLAKQKTNKSKGNLITALPTSNLLTKKSDVQDTIVQLEAVLNLAAPPCPCNSKQLDSFYESVSDYEQQIETQYSQLKKSIESDRELLTLERTELLDSLTVSQNKLVTNLKRLVACGETLEALTDFQSEPEYAQFLLSNEFYRETGGVKIYRTPDGCALISLGKAIVSAKPGQKPAMAIRNANRVAEIRAKSALAGEINGTKVETKETYTETTTVNQYSSPDVEVLTVEEYSQIIEESATAFLERVRPVASWRSSDGTEVFVVLGMFRR